MPTSTVYRRRMTPQVDVPEHPGIQLGETIDLDKLPGGRLVLKSALPAENIHSFLGFLADKSRKVATPRNISETASAKWAERTLFGASYSDKKISS
jgi:hypothetical protein